jgi:ABC-type molybdenum transport system ATPase subunit/photorepair protein PhrA
VIVGENGSGKSTVVETLAEAYGLNPQGGWGIRAARWDELDVVRHWRLFLAEPDAYFRRLFDD